ncbi:MAG: glutamate racemase [Verrucomicrobiota bacterium]
MSKAESRRTPLKSAKRKSPAPATERKTAPVIRPIGIFDSGIGGLTVTAALRKLLPAENLFYLGDTARVPYGGKSQQTIERYSTEITGLLLAEQSKIIVVACNTASALAIPRLEEMLKVPVIGVIAPGARAAVEATRNGHIGVIGTRATIYSGAYERAIQAINPDIRITSQACPMLVPLIEEGWLDDPVTDQVIRRYLGKLVRAGIDTLVLGCTHYPLLSDALKKFTGPEIRLVDSAHNCALAVKKLLTRESLSAPANNLGKLQVALTDPSSAFLRVAEEALGLQVGDVQLRAVQNAGPL